MPRNLKITSVVIDISFHPSALHKYSDQFQCFFINRDVRSLQLVHDTEKILLIPVGKEQFQLAGIAREHSWILLHGTLCPLAAFFIIWNLHQPCTQFFVDHTADLFRFQTPGLLKYLIHSLNHGILFQICQN